MSTAERVFRLFLRAYPAEFRAEYEREMMLVFRDQRRDGRGGVRFWAACSWDVARTAPALRVEAWQSPRHVHTQFTEGVAMRKTMAILSILIGAFETANSLVEGWGAVAIGLDAYAVLSVTLGVVAGLLLLASGIALASGSPKAPSLSFGAAVFCLAVFVLIGVAVARMSIFSTMLGIGFPIALLLFLRRGRGQPARMIV